MKHSNKLVLGSQSPRRQALLRDAGFQFEVKKIDVDESFAESIPARDVASFLAREKNKTYRQSVPPDVIVTADTVVIQDGKILGKPSDEVEANRMLAALSGNIHEVVTGVCISSPEFVETFSSLTEVKTKMLTKREIEHYINYYRPFDKAGAYGIQEWFGLIAIEWIKGSYYNVVGLPIDLVYKSLVEKFDIHPNKDAT